MSTLHTVNKSPFSHTTLSSCLQVCGKQDGILLLEDGVFGGLTGSPCAEELAELMNQNIKIYALAVDVNARGLQEKIHKDIQIIDYSDFVKLSIQHNCAQSWY